MRSIEEVNAVLALVEQGLNDCEIARRTGIPRGTVRDWRRGEVPRRGGWRRLGQNELGCPVCGHRRHDPDALPQETYAYLLGLYLGDGTISAARRGVYKLRIFLDKKYPAIVDECQAAMAGVMPTSGTGRLLRPSNCFEVYSYSKAWPCLFPQHGPGKKHLREIRLGDWQKSIADRCPEALLRGLVHSDGSHSVNTIRHPKKTYVYPRYLFSNRSEAIRRIFCDACDQIGVEWRQMNRFDISVAKRDSVATLDEFIGPKE